MPDHQKDDGERLLNPNCTITLKQNKWLEEKAAAYNTSKAVVLRDAITAAMVTDE